MMGGIVNRGAYVSDSLLLLLLLLFVEMTTAGDDGCADNGERISCEVLMLHADALTSLRICSPCSARLLQSA